MAESKQKIISNENLARLGYLIGIASYMNAGHQHTDWASGKYSQVILLLSQACIIQQQNDSTIVSAAFEFEQLHMRRHKSIPFIAIGSCELQSADVKDSAWWPSALKALLRKKKSLLQQLQLDLITYYMKESHK